MRACERACERACVRAYLLSLARALACVRAGVRAFVVRACVFSVSTPPCRSGRQLPGTLEHGLWIHRPRCRRRVPFHHRTVWPKISASGPGTHAERGLGRGGCKTRELEKRRIYHLDVRATATRGAQAVVIVARGHVCGVQARWPIGARLAVRIGARSARDPILANRALPVGAVPTLASKLKGVWIG